MEIKDRVLIVEDDKNIRKFIQTILEANDYDVIATETGKEAYSLITSRCPDVVILDLGLPDMDGMKILKEVRAWSNMPIIVVSARDHEKDKVEALDMGADDYITKPFGTSELLARIRAAIRHFRGTSKNQGERQKVTFLNGKLVIDYDKLWLTGIFFDFSTDICHIHTQDTVIPLHVWSPDFFHHVIICQNLACIFSKET